MKSTSFFLFSLAMCVLFILAVPVSARFFGESFDCTEGNLSNYNFETGDSTGWSFEVSPAPAVVSNESQEGNYSVLFSQNNNIILQFYFPNYTEVHAIGFWTKYSAGSGIIAVTYEEGISIINDTDFTYHQTTFTPYTIDGVSIINYPDPYSVFFIDNISVFCADLLFAADFYESDEIYNFTVGESSYFNDDSGDYDVEDPPENITWLWDFGDDTSSTQQNPEHEYDCSGLMDVSLTISDGETTNTTTKYSYITVEGSPVCGEGTPTPTPTPPINCGSSSGNITIAPITGGGDWVELGWNSSSNITSVVIDSRLISDFDLNSSSVVLTGVANSYHTLKLYNETGFGLIGCSLNPFSIAPIVMSSTDTGSQLNWFLLLGVGFLIIILVTRR